MNHDQEPKVVAVWHTACAVGRHFEELLADGAVHAWTEPPFGETYYPGDVPALGTPQLRQPADPAVTLAERERDSGVTLLERGVTPP